jgi:hypothetical protein
MSRFDPDVPPQESKERWLNSFLLGRDVELQELYELPTRELDLIRAEALTVMSDPETRRIKYLFASYFEKLAQIITDRRIAEERDQ